LSERWFTPISTRGNIILKAFIVAALISLGLAGAAAAQNCPAYPYTLTNGVTADATQVMADLNTVLNCANNHMTNPVFTGSVGIDTSAPIATIDVNGSAHFSGNCSSNLSSQGAYISWNRLSCGIGESDFINNPGGGSGGFAFILGNAQGAVVKTAMFINGSGGVGIGTTNPTNLLDVVGTISASDLTLSGSFWATNGNVSAQSFSYSSGGGNMAADTQNVYIRGVSGIAFQDAAATTTYGYLNTSNTSGLWINGVQYYSDARLKTNIQNFTGGLSALDQLRPVRYNWRATADRSVGKKLGLATADPQIGLIAQEVGAVVPEAVATDKDGIYGVKENVLIPVLIQAVKELHAEVEALKAQIATQPKNN
jgi:hypothetical protein